MRLLRAEDIERLYERFVLPNDTSEHAKRYSRLPKQQKNQSWKWEGKDFARVIALLEFARMAAQYQLRAKHLLTFNGIGDPELEHLHFDRHSNFDYAENPDANDLLSLHIPADHYDFVLLNQTLEHLYDPFRALGNVRDYVVPGAFVYANVPTVNIAHSTPFHYYTGLTPTGLACLFHASDFEIIEIGQWGNLEYISKLFKMQSWPDYRQLRSYTNDFRNPVITWVLARKA